MKPKKQLLPDDKEQSAKFIETAERIKSDDDKEQFEKVCKKIIKPKRYR